MNGLRCLFRLSLGLWCVVAATFSLTAQQYKSARTQGRVFYRGGGEVHTIQVISQQYLGGKDTAFTFYTVVDSVAGLPANCPVSPAATGWLGKRMVVKDSLWNYFFNKNGDTITFRPGAALGNQYPIYRFPNGDYIEATNIELQFDVIIDSFSRYKTISLQAKNAGGQPIAHPMNGKRMRFSEKFGFIETFNLYHFPEDTTRYKLIGYAPAQLGQRPMSPYAVFDIRPGYEFHYLEWTNGLLTAYEKRFVHQAFDIGTGDTFRLEEERWRHEYVYASQGAIVDSSYYNDTLTSLIAYGNYDYLNSNTRQVFEYQPGRYGYTIHRLEDSLGPRIRIDVQRPYALQMSGQCMAPQADSVLQAWFGDGLGQTRLTIRKAYGDIWQRQLVYYQRGIEKWGNPVKFDPNAVPFTKEPTITLFPNPAQNNITISGIRQPVTYRILTLLGRVIQQGVVMPDAQISVASLPRGYYFLSLPGIATMSFIKN